MSAVTNRTQRILLSIVSIGFCFGFSGTTQAMIATKDTDQQDQQQDAYFDFIYGDLMKQFDMTATNVQSQTSDTVSEGIVPPSVQGLGSAIGTALGLAVQSMVTTVTGVFNFKTAINSVVKTMIKQILADVKTWAKSGFKGMPNFIKDWKGFLQGAALAASAEFIRNWPELAQFCSPVKITLSEKFFGAKFSEQQKAFGKFVQKNNMPGNRCNIEKVVNNIMGTTVNYKGSLTTFATSGWNKKGGSTISAGLMNPKNNTLGLLFMATDEKMTKVAQRSNASNSQAKANDGFLNIVDTNGCLPKNPQTGEQTCPAQMAGKFVSDTLKETGLGEYTSMIGMNDMNDVFVGIMTSSLSSLTGGIRNWIQLRFNDALTQMSQ
jgi:hypothetical protein